MSSPRTGILSLIRFDLGWVQSWVWWWRMLQILWRNLNNLWSGLGGYTLWGSEEWSGESRLKGLVVEEVANSVISEEVVQFIWVVGGWWRRLYNSFELGVGGGGGYTPCNQSAGVLKNQVYFPTFYEFKSSMSSPKTFFKWKYILVGPPKKIFSLIRGGKHPSTSANISAKRERICWNFVRGVTNSAWNDRGGIGTETFK